MTFREFIQVHFVPHKEHSMVLIAINLALLFRNSVATLRGVKRNKRTHCAVKTQYPMRTVTKLRDVSSVSAVMRKQ